MILVEHLALRWKVTHTPRRRIVLKVALRFARGYGQYDSLRETFDILLDQAFSERLGKSMNEAWEGKTMTSDEVRRRLRIGRFTPLSK